MNESLNLYSSVPDHRVIPESVVAGAGFKSRSAGHGTGLLAPIVAVASLLLSCHLTGWLAFDVRDIPTMSAANLMLATLFRGEVRRPRASMQAVVVAGLIAVSSTLAALLMHAATNPQAYI